MGMFDFVPSDDVKFIIPRDDVKLIIPHDLSLDSIFKPDPDFELKTRIRMMCNIVRRD